MKLRPQQSDTLPPAKPRIAGIAGLSARKLPVDGTVIPKALISWVAAREGRSAALAPKIYELPVEGQNATRTLVGEHQTQRDVTASRRRYRLAKHGATGKAEKNAGPVGLKAALSSNASSESPKTDDRPEQTLLQPEDLWALSHILMLLKYPDAPLGVVVEHEQFQKRVEMFIQPAQIIKRMGYSVYGERYDRLEASLQRLAQLVVVEEVYNPNTKEWVAENRGAEPILSTLNTGRCSIENGVNVTPSAEGGCTRRLSEWRLAPGRVLIRMLNATPSDLVVVPALFWKAAGRSKTLQYFALDASRFGFDDNERMFPTKIRTLLDRARLLDDQAHYHSFVQKELALDVDTQARQKTHDFRERARHAGRAIRQNVRHIDRALARFSRRLGFADIRVELGNQSDLSPSQREKGQRSLGDRVQFIRWDGRIEEALSALPLPLHTALRNSIRESNALIKRLRQTDTAATADQSAGLASAIAGITGQLRGTTHRFSVTLAQRTLHYMTRLCAVASGLISAEFAPITEQRPSLLLL